jgi:hypothetical protein
LRRGLQSLDKVFSGLSAPAQDETVADGIAQLRSCIELIRQSDRPADHDQLEGIEKALALLAPPEDAVPAPPLPDLVLSPEREDTASRAGRGVESSRTVGGRPARGRSLAHEIRTAGRLLAGYQAKLHMLHVVASEPASMLSDLDAASAELEKQVRALKWMGQERIPEILRAADDAENLADRLAAGAALVHLGDAHGAEMVIDLLNRAAAQKQDLPETSPTLLRTLADEKVRQWLLEVFLLPAHPKVCALLLPVLVEHNLLPSEQLWQLLAHPKDEVAIEAARALAWADGEGDPQTLMAQVAMARTNRRANALLFAAALRGSQAALAEVRARAQIGEQVDRLLIDVLAATGDASDAALLIGLAERADSDVEYLLLAAANLGSAETLAALSALEDRVSAGVLEEVRRMIAGDSAKDHTAGQRWLRGQPWSVAGLLDRLQAADQTLQAQQQMALELRARTGQVPPSGLPSLLAASARAELLAGWKSHYAKANAGLKPGCWYHQGKPAKAALKGASV